jgi:hypothetical protein
MTTFTLHEAEHGLKGILEQARRDGEVRIQADGGEEFVLKPAARVRSPLDVKGVDLKVTADDIVEAVRESRER